MSTLQLVVKKENCDFESKLFFKPGESLLLLCENAGIEVNGSCQGKGICGQCQVLFLKGAPVPTTIERKFISPQKLREGYRLLCLSKVYQDCTVILPEKKEIQVVQEKLCITWENDRQFQEDSNPEQKFFVAVDIGTTTVIMQKRSLKDGSLIDTYRAVNPQKKYGPDVISRMEASIKGYQKDLQELITGQIGKGLDYLDRENVSFMVIAANTPMTHLFMGYDVEKLAKAPFVPKTVEEIETVIDGIPTYLMPGISAFVGGDIYGGLLAIDHNENYVNKKNPLKLLIDLGTNAEMVLYDDNRMIGTSAAAGSAFDAIGDVGFYGADVISILYQLLKNKQIDNHGTLKEPYFQKGIPILAEDGSQRREVYITQEHVRQIQLAKAAVRCGIDYLAEALGCTIEHIDCVYLAGGFGYYLDPKKAVYIGLLPKELDGKIISCGNTALAGACIYGYEKMKDNINLNYVNRCKVINLAMEDDFSKRYLDYIDFYD